ncbi:hypothetical protein DRN75_03805 [Nanoarchaeota archaeon]|nr:MAG: hypothetical protein DRN75_03805 [Nanoarchaeota archaeon]
MNALWITDSLKLLTFCLNKGEKTFSDTRTGRKELVGLGYIHRAASHSDRKYAKGKVHINGIERDSEVYPKQTCLVTKGFERRTGMNI